MWYGSEIEKYEVIVETIFKKGRLAVVHSGRRMLQGDLKTGKKVFFKFTEKTKNNAPNDGWQRGSQSVQKILKRFWWVPKGSEKKLEQRQKTIKNLLGPLSKELVVKGDIRGYFSRV